MSDTTDNQQTQTNGAAAPPPPAPEPTLEELASKLFKPDATEAKTATEETDGKQPDAKTVDEKTPDAKGEPAQEKDVRVAKRIEVATRAELRAAEARRELSALQQQLDTRTKDLDAREAKIKLLESDPVRAFEELKLDPKAFLEKLTEEQAPDNVMAKRLSTLEEQLTKEREERTRLVQETQRRQRAAQVDAEWNAASEHFIAHVGEHAEKFPHLVAEFTEAEAIAEADRVLSEVVGKTKDGQPVSRAEAYAHKYGDYPDNDVIAEHLDALAKQRVAARENSAWRKRNGDTTATSSQGSKSGDKEEARTVRGSNPRTLTSREASERGTAPKPWSQESADEESTRILEEALRRNR